MLISVSLLWTKIDVPGKHFVEVLDLLAVPDGLDDVEQRLVPLLFSGPNHTLVIGFIVAELKHFGLLSLF